MLITLSHNTWLQACQLHRKIGSEALKTKDKIKDIREKTIIALNMQPRKSWLKVLGCSYNVPESEKTVHRCRQIVAEGIGAALENARAHAHVHTQTHKHTPLHCYL